MNTFFHSSFAWFLSFCGIVVTLSAQEPAKSDAASDFDDLDWPQSFETLDGFEVAVFQPQIHEWTEYRRMTARSAVAVKPKGASEDKISYGALTVEANTTVDQEERVVFFSERKITSLEFPNAADEATSARYRKAVESVLTPQRPLTMNLDRVLANAERSEQQAKVSGISVDPPPIFFSSEPAILVIFLGPAKFETIEKSSLFFAANTNWDLLLDPDTGTYYLLAGDIWLSTKSIAKGPWVATTTLPTAIASLPRTDDWKEILDAYPPKPGIAPKVFVSERPAELILTTGKPQISPIVGTGIFYLVNSESDLFLYDSTYYFLSAGRWFSAENPQGPWASAMDRIPDEFAKIPDEHPKSHVLASVPGTPDAEEALIAAQIPQTAKVERSEAKLEIKYEEDPKFVSIKGTTVQYAINSPNDVFLVDGRYYCCEKGVWFEAASATGPWTVCSNVPEDIYTIPASSPKHNVTYVHVYDSDEKTVTTGYTSGYNGAYVLGDLLVFGAGLWIASEILDDWDDHWYHCHWHYHACHWSYGCGARYSYYNGGYYRSGYRYYGPYGGAGAGAVYNPWTGGYARAGRVYGPRGTAYAREGYNPWTDTYGARVGANTPYGSWGRSVVARDDEWVRGGYRSGARGTVRAFETSEGAGGVKVNRRFGPDSFLGKSKDDDMYVGRDGNLYRRDNDGNWDKLGRGGWDNIERPQPHTITPARGTREGTRTAIPSRRPSTQVQPTRPSTRPGTRPELPGTRPGTQPTRPSTRPSIQPTQPTTRPSIQPSTRPTPARTPRSTPSQLQRDYSARSRGSTRTSRSRTFSRSSGTSRSRGGGRRR